MRINILTNQVPFFLPGLTVQCSVLSEDTQSKGAFLSSQKMRAKITQEAIKELRGMGNKFALEEVQACFCSALQED